MFSMERGLYGGRAVSASTGLWCGRAERLCLGMRAATLVRVPGRPLSET